MFHAGVPIAYLSDFQSAPRMGQISGGRRILGVCLAPSFLQMNWARGCIGTQ